MPVADQSILKVQDATSTLIRRGHAKLNVRIEEVSRNHRQQCFVVKVGPNAKVCPLDQDVGPALSPRVAVFSKHTKKRPEEESPSASSSSPSSSSTSSSSSAPSSSAASTAVNSSTSCVAKSSAGCSGQSSYPVTPPCAHAPLELVPIPEVPFRSHSGRPRDSQAGRCFHPLSQSLCTLTSMILFCSFHGMSFDFGFLRLSRTTEPHPLLFESSPQLWTAPCHGSVACCPSSKLSARTLTC